MKLLLNKYHVKLVTPFTEMDKIEKYPELIKQMYTKISEQYEGEMGFEEATNVMLMGTSSLNQTPIHTEEAFARLVKNFTFWDWKDSKGRPMRLEYSCWIPPLETQKDQRASVMPGNFVKFWSIAVDYYRSKYPQDPQMFGELGVNNGDGASLGANRRYFGTKDDFYTLKDKGFDYQEMADMWEAYLKGAKALGIESINIWGFPLGDLWPNNFIGNYFINIGMRQPEMPAYYIIKAIIGPAG